MTFPTVADIGITVSGAAMTNHACNYPATVTSGQLLLYFVGCDGSGDTPTITGVAGINLLFSGSHLNHGSAVYWLLAGGTEGGTTFNVNVTSGEAVCAYCFAIDDWDGVTDPEISTVVTGDSDFPDPGSLTPSWGAEDNLYVAFATRDTNDPLTAFPTNYNDDQNGDESTTNAIGIATRALASSPEDPGTFVFGNAETWAAFTIAVRPSNGGNGGSTLSMGGIIINP